MCAAYGHGCAQRRLRQIGFQGRGTDLCTSGLWTGQPLLVDNPDIPTPATRLGTVSQRRPALTKPVDRLEATGNGESGQLPALAWVALGAAPTWISVLVFVSGAGLGNEIFTWLVAMPVATLVWLGLLCARVHTFVTAGGLRVSRLAFFFSFLALNMVLWIAVVAGALYFVLGVTESFH